MTAQRVRVAESRIRNNLSNGPRRARGKILSEFSILRREAYVSCREYEGTPQSARVKS